MTTEIGRSVLLQTRLRQAETEQSELLGRYAAAVRKARGQLAILSRTHRHTHLGGCASKLGPFPYDPADCDCDGPRRAFRHDALIGQLLSMWSDARPEHRLGVISLLDAAFNSLGPMVETCPNCNGTAWNPAGRQCPTCNATCVVAVLKDGAEQWLTVR